MNFCFSVCEYDPLHNGHAYHIQQMKKTGCDAVGIIMSGNFTQRGEIAVIDKYTRAQHAILAGADVVFELPTVFATAPAEIFATGAVKLISSIMGENMLCFGAEVGEKEDFIRIASIMNEESKEFKEELKRLLALGHPFALARTEAMKNIYSEVNTTLLDSPNSILGVEYTRAILRQERFVDIYPVKRIGTEYKDVTAKGEICSSTAVRQAIVNNKTNRFKKCMPSYVYNSLPKKLPNCGDLALFSILSKPSSELRDLIDCSEGLENRIKAIARGSIDFESYMDKLVTRRYTKARLTRMSTANMLGITRSLVEKSLKGNLYLKVLAIADDKTDILSACANGRNKLITRKSDADSLGGIADDCFNVDVFASEIFSLASKTPCGAYDMRVVKR